MKNITNQLLQHSRGLAFATLLCAGVLLGSGLGLQTRALSADAPVAWSVTNQLGKQVNSSSMVGRVTIVNFWATYCIPCMIEMPTLHELETKYGKSGLSIVGVSVDAQSNAMLQAFVEKFKMNYTVAMANPEIMSGFRVNDSVPMTFILDQQGRIVRKHAGYVKKEELEKDVRELLKL